MACDIASHRSRRHFSLGCSLATKRKPDASVQALGGVIWGTDTVGGMYVVSGKAQLACECVGHPEGVDVFLIHAGVTDRRSWQHVIDRLGLQHRCVSYDARGYGETLYARIRDSRLDGPELMEKLQADLNAASPTRFARFQLVLGKQGRLAVGDEYVVRMPGPWDGPVRVIGVSRCSFRLATLTGHLEAGQIEFRAGAAKTDVVFEIESWARSASPLVNLLYHRARMAKEVQAHMWISFLERVVQLAGGHMTGGIDLATERVEMPTASS